MVVYFMKSFLHLFLHRDLCGAVSDPLTVCRTIVVGKSSSLVRCLLYLLTYFIQCSEIEEQGIFKHVIDSHSHLQGHDLKESSIFPQNHVLIQHYLYQVNEEKVPPSHL